MVVEDESRVARLTIRTLQRFGYTIAGSTTSGEEAVKMAEKSRPDLVLMDISLSGPIDGIEAARQIQSRLNIPIIYLTADADPSTVDRAKLSEPAGYLLKPFRPEDLRTTIETALYQWQRIRNWANELLHEGEEKFRNLFETSRDAIMLLGPTGFFDCNRATLEIFGCASKDQFIHRHPSELSPPRQLDGTDSIAAAQGHIEAAYAKGSQFFEWLHQRMDGTVFLAEVFLSRFEFQGKNVLQAVVRDITARKQAEEQLRNSEVLYHSLVENLPQNVFRKDAQGRFTFVNHRFCRTTGRREEEILGKTDFDFYPAELARKYRDDDLRIMESGEISEIVEEHQAPDSPRSYVRVIKSPLRDAQGNAIGIQAIFWDITEGKRTGDQLRMLSLAVEQSPASVVITDPRGNIGYVNRKFVEVAGYTSEEVAGKNPRVLKSGETSSEDYTELWRTITAGREWHGEFHNRKKNGELYWESAMITPIKNQSGEITHYLAIKEDITERKLAEEDRAMMEIQLRQALKLEAVGRLAAGIAHEINTPTQYIGDNTRFLQEAFIDLAKTLENYSRLLSACKDGGHASAVVKEAESVNEQVDLDYLLKEIPRAIGQSLEGVGRVAMIVQAMKEFSHPGGDEKQAIDLNRMIESTITVARNEWKYVADLVRDLDPELPSVPCLAGEFNQVILNLVVNAAHAIGDVVGKGENGKGTITVSTRTEGAWAVVRITDTGGGIPESIREKIFDPFFTTKEVGKGTGQGLAIARAVIVGKHHGMIDFDTTVGVGTTFTIRLPLESMNV